MLSRILGMIGLGFLAAGCGRELASTHTPATQVLLIGREIQRSEPSLKDSRFSTLLDFESPSDEVFVNAVGATGAVTASKSHTGHASYQIGPNAQRLTVKLSSLLAGRTFPGDWTLVGGYVYSDRDCRVRITLDPAPADMKNRAIDLTPNTWTPVFVELPQPAASAKTPSLVFDLTAAPGTLWFDDIMLVNNQKIFTGEDAPTPWRIERKGFSYIGTAPGFSFTLVGAEASSSGWALDEANMLRARFHCPQASAGSSGGKSLTVYSDGRAYWDGQYRPMAAGLGPLDAAAHQSPGTIDVAEAQGRVDRNTPGDGNNDGYNEITGSYRIIANGPRIEIHLTPNASSLIRPVLEVTGLPPGKPLVTLEGRLIEQVCRISSGSVLVVLPARIDRGVTVNIGIQ